MTTGSGTGTPATGRSAATVATLRARVRTQLESAGGFPEPLVVTPSSETLTTLRARVQARLQDASALRWATADLDEAIRTAIQQYTLKNPRRTVGTITLSAASREVSLSSLTGLIRVEQVWYPYTAASPEYPPEMIQFDVWPGGILFLDVPNLPAIGQVARVFYTTAHTLNGLDSATTTTIPAEDVEIIVTGGAYFAAQQRAVELAESLQFDSSVVKRLADWAAEQGRNFRYNVDLRPPAWQRFAYAYDQDDIDEGIRWALQRYSEVSPDQATTTVTLAAAGREVSIAAITDYLEILRVWWDYDASSPGHPPAWRRFELWPGSVLFINDTSEPQAGDIVRIWYTRLHALNGLDGASTTTIPADAETLIVTGAAGYAAQERVQEQPGTHVPRRLAEWSEQRLKEFERGLNQVARRRAARHSGIAPGPDLDRYESEGRGWR